MSRLIQDLHFWLDWSTVAYSRGAASITMGTITTKIPEGRSLVLITRGKDEKHNWWPCSGSIASHFFQHWEIKQLLGWFWWDRTAFKPKAVLTSGQLYHMAIDMWMRVGSKNYPHHTLKFDYLRWAIISATIQSLQAQSTISLRKVVWWGWGLRNMASCWNDAHLHCRFK